MAFAHLHTHTEYSLLDGLARPQALVARAREREITAIAITDHGALHGVPAFVRAAQAAEVLPIVGCEMYLTPSGHRQRERRDHTHLTVLALNERGYRNLVRLVSIAHTDGWYYHPRIDLELLARYREGLFVLSGCYAGYVAEPLTRPSAGEREVAESYRRLRQLQEIMGDYCAVELMRHKDEAQGGYLEDRVLPILVEHAQRAGLPCVVTGDAHYVDLDDARAHDVMLCVGTHATVKQKERFRFSAPDYDLKSAQEMLDRGADLPPKLREAWGNGCYNTRVVVSKVEPYALERTPMLPVYTALDKGSAARSPDDLLVQLVEEGIVRRYGARANDPQVRARVNEEMQTILKMGFASYFLIVWDTIAYARSRGIPVGPGRGSVVGSVVAYALGITDLDPLAHGLLFERFLNPDRVSLPDIDTDICMERREEVIAYLRERYGDEHVAQIATIDRMKALLALRDVARALGCDQASINALAAAMPKQMTIAQALENDQQFAAFVQQRSDYQEIVALAQAIEGTARHIGVHAAGIVISPEPITAWVPVMRDKHGKTVTQYDMGDIERMGLVKFDFLGLRNLTMLHEVEQMIRAHDAPSFSFSDLSLDDAQAYALIASGKTMGVFQLESEGIRRVCERMQVRSFADLIAVIALYRPGPLSIIDDFLAVRSGRCPKVVLHPKLDAILDETYGFPIYQEQVMQIARVLAGFSRGEADELRKVMGKKQREKVEIYRERFIEGAMQHSGLSAKKAAEIFAYIEPFAGYGFNKSHAAAYALIAYRTAWAKAHYPAIFWAAELSSVEGKADEVATYIHAARREGVEVLPVDLWRSERRSVVERMEDGKLAIRLGFGAIRGLGEATIAAILGQRAQWAAQADRIAQWEAVTREIGRAATELLAKAGALDTLGQREELLEALAHRRSLYQRGLFAPTPAARARSRAQGEREVYGLYLTAHPLAEFNPVRARAIFPEAITERSCGQYVRVAGVLMHVVQRQGRSGLVIFGTLDAPRGSVSVVCFGDDARRVQARLVEGAPVLCAGEVARRGEGELRLVVREVEPLEVGLRPSAQLA